MQNFDPWKETPRKYIVVLLLSVFLLFTTIGFAEDIAGMGRQQPIRFVLGIVLSGLFAVIYAIVGISLGKKWWRGALLLFVVQSVVMSLVAYRFPDRPAHISMTAADLGLLHSRLIFDSIATIAAIGLGYSGVFYVSVMEAQRYVKTRTENILFESEMAAARQVQQVILPNPHQSLPGFAVDSVYKPAREVGGDFFQILPVENGGLLFVIGDVAGKGLPAAMLVSLLIGSIRAIAEDTHDPVILLRRLNDQIQNQIVGHATPRFVTALAAFIANDGLATFANAGHLPPYLDGKEIELPGDLPLGIIGAVRYEAVKSQLPPGSRLTFFSDGVVEAQNERGELFGFDQARIISRDPAAAIAEAAVHFGQADDITVVTIERQTTSLSR